MSERKPATNKNIGMVAVNSYNLPSPSQSLKCNMIDITKTIRSMKQVIAQIVSTTSIGNMGQIIVRRRGFQNELKVFGPNGVLG